MTPLLDSEMQFGIPVAFNPGPMPRPTPGNGKKGAKPIVPIARFTHPISVKGNSASVSGVSIDVIRQQLHQEIEVLKDRLGRAHDALRDEIAYWERGLKDNEWEGFDAVRRRLSRLKGSVEYLGSPAGLYRKKVEPRK